jgi:hypothetical protein
VLPTLLILAAAVAAFAVARHLHDRPYEPGRGWGTPYLAIMFVAALVAVLALAHLATLFTGRPFVGRMGF